jgi:hypothetical protein
MPRDGRLPLRGEKKHGVREGAVSPRKVFVLGYSDARVSPDRLTEAGRGFPVPVPGFGSSDCTRCVSHLFAWPEGTVLPWVDQSQAAREVSVAGTVPEVDPAPLEAVAAVDVSVELFWPASHS